MKIVIVGADGMIGHSIWKYFVRKTKHDIYAAVRTARDSSAFNEREPDKLFIGATANAAATLDLFNKVRPDVIINCGGVTKHADAGDEPIAVITSNSVFPHELHKAARSVSARMIQISTDCVYDGEKGDYLETDTPTSTDLYGHSKVLGEIVDAKDVLTIRISTIGYELGSNRGLLEWFLSQQGQCKGFRNAYFSGVSSVGVGKIIDQHILPNPELHGLLHVAGPKINKYDLLLKFREHFGKEIEIVPEDSFHIDRSLDGTKFASATGYVAPSWNEMLAEMIEIGR